MKNYIACVAVLCLAVGCYAADELREISFKTTSQQFAAGDSIVLEHVLATSPALKVGDTVVIRGKFHLASQPKARLGFFLTTKEPSAPTAISPGQQAKIAAGDGTFELQHIVPADGRLHVSFYPAAGGSSFGGVYFAAAP